MSNTEVRRLLGIVLAGATLTACGGGDGGVSNATGHVSVSLTDAPVDGADAVVLRVTGVAFKPEGSAPEVVQSFTARDIDLLQYQQGRAAVLLDDVPLSAGRYQWLRLIIENQANVRDSYAVVEGQECELRVPSGAERGLQMNRPIDVPANGSLALTVDFDLRQSLRAPPGQPSGTGACTQGYMLRPTLRLVNDAQVGAIAGGISFAGGAVPANCLPKVYVYEGSVAPDDVEESTSTSPDVDPLMVVGVDIPAGQTSGTYRAAFVPAGSYTAAFTCSEDTDADESLTFVPAAGTAVTVQNNVISTVSFTVPAASP